MVSVARGRQPAVSATATTASTSRRPHAGSCARRVEGAVAGADKIITAAKRSINEHHAGGWQDRGGLAEQRAGHRPGRNMQEIDRHHRRQTGQVLDRPIRRQTIEMTGRQRPRRVRLGAPRLD